MASNNAEQNHKLIDDKVEILSNLFRGRNRCGA